MYFGINNFTKGRTNGQFRHLKISYPNNKVKTPITSKKNSEKNNLQFSEKIHSFVNFTHFLNTLLLYFTCVGLCLTVYRHSCAGARPPDTNASTQ